MLILAFSVPALSAAENDMQFHSDDGYFDYNFDFSRPFVLVDTTEIDSVIAAHMDSLHIPGLSACAIKDGHVIWSGAYGYANIEENIDVDESTLFNLYSVSKSVTVTALMQQYEAGLFDLDDDINDYLPFEVANPTYPDSTITIRMLLTHTSSIEDNWDVLDSLITQGDSPVALDYFLENYLCPGGEYYSADSNYDPVVPGTVWDHTNVGIALAGYLVEAVSNNAITFPDQCRDSIFLPLEMNYTSWFWSELDTADCAKMYRYNGSNFVPYGFRGCPYYPAGMLKTSPLQLSRFLTAYMQYGQIGSTRILDSTTVRLIATIQYPGIADFQGLVWYTNTLGGRLIWGLHGGSYGGSTEMWYCPAESTAVISLCNGEGAGIQLGIVDLLFDYAAEYVVGIEETTENPQIPAEFALLQNYPNPFNATTSIEFTLNKVSDVRLEIYNLRGRLIERLIDERINPGYYRARWNAADLASGLYFYRLTTSSGTISKTMTLLK